jgi:hypothetical protein
MPAKKSAAAKSAKAAPRASSRSNRRPSKSRGDAGQKIVTLDRRRSDRRNESAPTQEATAPPPAALERRKKVQRRRQIDPTTCERDYSVEEVEFMNAMDEYKRKSGRMFPTCSEVLEVIRDLGYVKLSMSERTLLGLDQASSAEQRLDAASDAVDALMEEAL